MNKEKIAVYKKAWALKNRTRLLAGKKEYWLKNREALLIKKRENHRKNRVRNLVSMKEYRLKNKIQINAQYKEYYIKKKDVICSVVKKYRKNNRGKINAIEAKRHSKKLRATPPWLTKDQYAEIRQFYVDAKECQWLSEEPLHVDHIIPLQGKEVCGLHVPWNLRVIPASINSSKSNKMEIWLP